MKQLSVCGYHAEYDVCLCRLFTWRRHDWTSRKMFHAAVALRHPCDPFTVSFYFSLIYKRDIQTIVLVVCQVRRQ